MTLPPEYFDAMYEASPDPWGFTDRWYEQRKYALTLACLPGRRYARAYEPACSVGVLTRALASRCDHLLASDGAAAAVAQAADRVADLPWVSVEQRRLPEDWPPGGYDLVVLSEFLYYLQGADLSRTLAPAVAAVLPGGTLVAAHWRHPVADYPRTGDEVHAALADAAGPAGLVLLGRHLEADFVLDIYLRPHAGEQPARLSVASRAGLR